MMKKQFGLFDYPFIGQFSMIFNYEDENAEIKKFKKLCSLLEMLKRLGKLVYRTIIWSFF